MKTLKQLLAGKTQSLAAVSPKDTVFHALKVMADNKVGAVLVLDGDACDRANCMEGQMGTRFTAFLEMVGAQREERRLERSIR